MKISIVGLGWFGFELAKHLDANHSVLGSKSSPESISAGMYKGVEAHYLNWDDSNSFENLNVLLDADVLVLNIPPSRKREDVVKWYGENMYVMEQGILKSPLKKVIFISSTGVFGNREIVDEDTIPEPNTPSGTALFEAELRLLNNPKFKTSVIRPGGLIGGDRQPARYLAGREGIKGKNHPVNLVHRSDLIAITEKVIESSYTRRIFHAVAPEHPAKSDFYTVAAQKLGLEFPAFHPGDISDGKLVESEKTIEALGISMQYPNPYQMIEPN